MSVLETHDLTKDFAGFRAVDRVSIALDDGRVHALVGPNGAGKTTLFHMLTGFVKPTSGRIVAFGLDIAALAPDRISRLGVARSFQITSLFERRTALEHVVLALHSRDPLSFRFWRSEDVVAAYRGRALAILAETGLALSPRLLLLDEPTSGMSLEDVQRTIQLIKKIREGRTVLLVEHNMGVVGELADRVVVMQQGRIIADGAYDDVRREPAVVAAY